MIETYAFYTGAVIMWVFGLVFVAEIIEVIRQRVAVITADSDTVAGAVVLFYVGISLLLLGSP